MEDVNELFPCKQLPADAGQQKLIGLYEQATDGVWLQRVKVPAGRLSAAQWRRLASVAESFSSSTPLHLTTRQDIEIHKLVPGDIPLLQRGLAIAGMTCFQAAGDTFRNTTVCTCSGTAGHADLAPLASAIEQTLAGLDGVYALPRKFKISLSCSRDCGQPWINDLGFVFKHRDGQVGFEVIGAGSLGAKPATGILLYEWIDAEHILAMTQAAVKVFALHGDRENRRKARLRHVRERLGDEQFAALLDEAFAAALSQRDWPPVSLPAGDDGLTESLTLNFANGDVSPNQARALADIASSEGFAVRIANQHRIVVFGPVGGKLAEMPTRYPMLATAAALKVSVVACPGKRWCRHAIAHTNELADTIREQCADVLPEGSTVCISGCPNGCSHPAVADFGLTGRIATIDGEKTEVFDLMAGGGMGHDARLAQKLAEKLTVDQVIAEIRRIAGSAPVQRAGKLEAET